MTSRRWTARELSFLDEKWGIWANERVATRLGRSVAACDIKARRGLKMKRRDQFLSLSGLTTFLDAHYDSVVKLIKTGEIRRRRAPIGGGRYGRQWVIHQDSLRYFLLQQPWAYDARRLRPDAVKYEAGDLDLIALASDTRALAERQGWITVTEAAPLLGYTYDHLNLLVGQFASVGKLERRRRLLHAPGNTLVARLEDLRAMVAEHRALIPARQSLAAQQRCALRGVHASHIAQQGAA